MTSKDYDLNLWEQNFVEIPAVQGEAQSRTVNFHLKEEVNTKNALGGMEIRQRAIDLTGCSVRFFLLKPDKTKVFCDGTVTDASNGIAAFTLPYQAAAAYGTVTGEVLVTKADGTTLKGIGVELRVTASGMEELESTDDFSALVTALNEVKTAAGTASQAAADAQEAVSDANGAIADINAKESEITTAEAERQTNEATRQNNESVRQTAETGRSDAEVARAAAESQRQTDTAAAIAHAETAAGNAETAAGRANTAAQNAENAIAGQLDPAIDARIAAKTNAPGGMAGYDAAQAHYTNTAAHITTLSTGIWDPSIPAYDFTGLTATAGKVPVLFTVDTKYNGGAIQIDGVPYTLRTRDGSALGALAWAADTIITGVADVDNKTLTVEPSVPVALPSPASLTVQNGPGNTPATYDGSTARTVQVPYFTVHSSAPSSTPGVGELYGVY